MAARVQRKTWNVTTFNGRIILRTDGSENRRLARLKLGAMPAPTSSSPKEKKEKTHKSSKAPDASSNSFGDLVHAFVAQMDADVAKLKSVAEQAKDAMAQEKLGQAMSDAIEKAKNKAKYAHNPPRVAHVENMRAKKLR